MDIETCLPTADELLAAYPQFAKSKDITKATVSAWIEQAATVVSLSGLLQAANVTPMIVKQAISYYAAHVGMLTLNQMSDTISIALAGATIQHADRSGTTDQYLPLYNDLLAKLGIGTNRVQFL